MTTTALKVNAYNSRVSSPTTSIFSPPHSPIHWKWWGSSAEPMRCNGGAPARGAWEMFVKMAWQYLGNGLTEWVQIWHTARYYTPANNACPNFEVPMHVRTCTPLFCISETTRPISLKFCIQATAQQPLLVHTSSKGCDCTCARAHPSFISWKLAARFSWNFAYTQVSYNHCWCSSQCWGAAARAHVRTPPLYLGNKQSHFVETLNTIMVPTTTAYSHLNSWYHN